MKLVAGDFLESVALVYGDECKSRFIDLAKKADPNSDLLQLLEDAFENQSDTRTRAISKLRSM